MDKEELVNHGFRSTLKDWVLNNDFPIERWRAQVDHELNDTQADNSYGDDDLLEKRRPMMQRWDNYLNAPPPVATGSSNVVTMPKRRTA